MSGGSFGAGEEGRTGGNAGSEEPVSKKRKKEVESAVESTSGHIALGNRGNPPLNRRLARRGLKRRKLLTQVSIHLKLLIVTWGVRLS
jgi:hypothetical protein